MSEANNRSNGTLGFTSTPVTEIAQRLSFGDYAKRPGISQSFLKSFDTDLGGCPALAIHNFLHPEDRKPSTDALEDGTKLHLFVLDPPEFVKRFAVLDNDTKERLFAEALVLKSKAKGFSKTLTTFKTWRDALDVEGRGYVDLEELAILNRMRDALFANKEVAEYLGGADYEVSVFAPYETPNGLLQTKGRIDVLPGARESIVDLKSCRTANPREFASQVGRLGYDIQAGLYVDLARLNGEKKTRFGFLAQDKFPPFLCCIHWLGEDWLRYGRVRYRKILLDVAEAIRLDLWPGYGSGELMPPTWMATEIEAIAA